MWLSSPFMASDVKHEWNTPDLQGFCALSCDRRSDRLFHGLSTTSRAWPTGPCPPRETTLVRFLSPIARSSRSLLIPEIPPPVRSAYRLSQPPSGFLLPLPWGFIARPWHLRGSPWEHSPHWQRRPLVGFGYILLSMRTVHVQLPALSQQDRWTPQPEGCSNPTHTPERRYWSANESVHDPHRASPVWAADTLLGLGAF